MDPYEIIDNLPWYLIVDKEFMKELISIIKEPSELMDILQ